MDNEEALVPARAAAPAGPNGSEAAAILLMMLGDAEAAEILSYLEPDEVQHLGSAMFGVADVSENQVETVFNTFMSPQQGADHDRLRRGAAHPRGDGACAGRRPRRERARPDHPADAQPRARSACAGWTPRPSPA